MALPQQGKKVIAELPLKDTLNHIRHRLRHSDIANPRQKNVASLLSALVGSPTAYSLPFTGGNANVAAKLFPIQQQVRGGLVKPGHFCALVCHVVFKSFDLDI
ncbi:serine/threonine-protein kinase Sgk2 [Xylaria arbuscula]|nr:serine/threonine-protein kinase Sgk2 [Xylaria arbuscula]